jgi:hypothetical protein
VGGICVLQQRRCSPRHECCVRAKRHSRHSYILTVADGRLSQTVSALCAGEAHLAGQVAATLMERAPELLAGDPSIERLDVVAGRVDVSALAPQPAG